MSEILSSFTVVAVAIVVGYAIGRSGLLGPQAIPVLTRLVFYVLAPSLMFSVLATADIRALFSSILPVSVIAAVLVMVVSATVSRVIFRWDPGRVVIGALSGAYVNANNIGIPVALYLLGDPVYAAPVVLFQMVIVAPIALTILDAQTRGSLSPSSITRAVLASPIVVASLLGLLVSISGAEVPDALLAPVEMIGMAAVPVILIVFGMSLAGQRLLQSGADRVPVIVLAAMKLLLMPAVAYLVGRFGFQLDGHPLHVVTVLAALPTAQNVFVYAQQFRTGQTLARDTIFLTTLGAVPVLVLITVLLG